MAMGSREQTAGQMEQTLLHTRECSRILPLKNTNGINSDATGIVVLLFLSGTFSANIVLTTFFSICPQASLSWDNLDLTQSLGTNIQFFHISPTYYLL